MTNSTVSAGLDTWGGMMDVENYRFMVDSPLTWTWQQALLFPTLFVVPAEILALVVDGMIAHYSKEPGLPSPANLKRTTLPWAPDLFYIWFNRLLLLPFVSWLNITVIWNSASIVWDFDAFTVANTLIAFLVVFALSDLVYYTGHRIVHAYPTLYAYVHKHHHQDAYPIRGWLDTCNAHPTDFFYTGFSTSPISVLWLMPLLNVQVHIATIGLLLYSNMFVGALGHCRLDFDIGIYRTRFHAGHHAMFKYNYAQNIEIWDRLFGTYKELPMPEKDGKMLKKIS